MSDKGDIEKFVGDVYAWLEACHLGKEPGQSRFPVIKIAAELQSSARDAWEEFAKDHPRDEFVPRMSDISERAKREYGLHGAQLKYKLKVIDLAAQSIQWGKLGKLIDLIDALLKSIIGAAGGGHALEELKEALKGSLPD